MKTTHFLKLGLILVLLVACTASPTLTPTPGKRLVTLQLQWVTQAQFAGYYVALDKGWYAEEGLEVKILPGGPDIMPVERVSSGAAQFGTTLLADLAAAVSQDKPVVSLAQVQQRNGLVLLAHKAAGIQGPADLRGKRVGVWLGSWEAQFDALMAQAGLTAQDFTLVNQGFSMDAFIRGDLDVASAMLYNEYQVVLEKGIAADALTIIDYQDYGLGFPGDTLFTSRKLLEQDPDLCQRMVRASLRGWAYALAHPDEAVDIVMRYDQTGTLEREHQEVMMQEIARLISVPGRPLGYTTPEEVTRVVQTLRKFGVLAVPVDPELVYTNAIWEQVKEQIQP